MEGKGEGEGEGEKEGGREGRTKARNGRTEVEGGVGDSRGSGEQIGGEWIPGADSVVVGFVRTPVPTNTHRACRYTQISCESCQIAKA